MYVFTQHNIPPFAGHKLMNSAHNSDWSKYLNIVLYCTLEQSRELQHSLG